MSGLQLWTRKEIFIFSITAKLILGYKIKTKTKTATNPTNQENKQKENSNNKKKIPTQLKTPLYTPWLLKYIRMLFPLRFYFGFYIYHISYWKKYEFTAAAMHHMLTTYVGR